MTQVLPASAPTRAEQVRTHLSTPLYKNAYALLLNSGLTALLGVAYWTVAARRYPPAEVGRASAEISAMILLSGLAQFNLQSAFPRVVPSAGASTRRIILTGYTATAAASFVAATAFVVCERYFGLGRGMLIGSWIVSAWFVVAVVTWTIFTLQDSVLAGLRQAVYVPIENVLFSIGKVALVIAFATVSVRFGLFASWTIPTAISLIPINWLIFRRLVPAHAAQTRTNAIPFSRRQLYRYVAGEYVGGIFSTVALTTLPLLVTTLLGLTANGYFYTAWVVGTSFDLILSQVGTALTVEGAHDELRFASVARRAARLGVFLLLPSVAVCEIGAHHVLSVLGPQYAAHGTVVLRLMVLGVVPKAVTFFFLSLSRIRRRARVIATVQVALCTTVLLFCWLGVRHWGLDGVGYGYAAAQVVVALPLIRPILRTLRQGVLAERGPR